MVWSPPSRFRNAINDFNALPVLEQDIHLAASVLR
jgi:hypothetical protein